MRITCIFLSVKVLFVKQAINGFLQKRILSEQPRFVLTKAFNIPENVVFEETLTLPNSTAH